MIVSSERGRARCHYYGHEHHRNGCSRIKLALFCYAGEAEQVHSKHDRQRKEYIH